ncbi:hypothetical protein QC763_602965 [Podospora pseudopauciseta]|uniref:Smr domain-containing protein n=2 Tax=Podospora TaxID=5144 RepID=A0ABR0H4H7_9PEZI|nr:hypothetical protein QC763_602965 [Podospora pseudopauciseta]KAK4671142.1 hypothetical protein QC764_602965 [Podospora pseudoanserina]
MASASEAGLWRLFFGPRQRSPFEDGRQQDPAELNRPLVYWRRSRLQTHEKGGLVVRQAMTQRHSAHNRVSALRQMTEDWRKTIGELQKKCIVTLLVVWGAGGVKRRAYGLVPKVLERCQVPGGRRAVYIDAR